MPLADRLFRPELKSKATPTIGQIRLAFAGAIRPKCVYRKKIPNCRRCVFFDCLQSRIVSRESACWYGRSASGKVEWQWDNSDPFGNNVPNQNPNGAGQFVFPLRFAGQYYDSETNLAYNYFRDYDPSIGRYVQSDPIGLGGSINTYGYVGGNPLRWVDPLGQDAILETPMGPLPIITPTQSTPNRGAGSSSTGNTDIEAGLPGGNASQSSSASNKNYSEQPSPNFPPSTGPNLPPGSGGGGICEAAYKLCLKGANVCGSFKPAATGICFAAYAACKIATLPHYPPPAP